MMTTLRRLARHRHAATGRGDRQRGSTAVEFALVMPVFLAVVFGVIEYGWVFYQQFNLAGAIRDGLRQGVTISQTASPDPRSTAVSKAQANLTTLGVSLTGVNLTATYNGTSPTKTMTLQGTMTYKKLIGFVPTPASLKYGMTMMLEMQ